LGLRQQISNLHSLFVLSMMMTESRNEDQILSLAASSVSPMVGCSVEGIYLLREGSLVPAHTGNGRGDLVPQLDGLGGIDGPVTVPGRSWSWAYPLRCLAGHSGYLIVSAPVEPSAEERFVLKALAQQAGTALASAELHRRDQLYVEELATVNEALAATVSDLERKNRIHDVLTRIAVSGGGEEGISGAVHELTGFPVAVEDRFGNLQAWAGPGRPDPYPKQDGRTRAALLRRARKEDRPIRQGDRLIALAQPRDEVLGVLALIDPRAEAGGQDVMALEHAATVLAMELAHRWGLAETELRLGRDLVEDLLAGAEEESALARAQALGYDLRRPHHVVVVQGRRVDEAFQDGVRRAAGELGMGSLLTKRSGAVVLLAPATSGWNELRESLVAELGRTVGAIGVGGRCQAPADFPRSCREAFVALKMQHVSPRSRGVTCFDDLGVYRVLCTGENTEEIERFVRDWLGPLQDYDAKHGTELVKTLSHYLECSGNYDETAELLAIHRSTLRYRLVRIREVSGLELGDADTRFNLQLATRSWSVIGAGEPS
jgi:DNA-binding PucR family transcriptional regulator